MSCLLLKHTAALIEALVFVSIDAGIHARHCCAPAGIALSSSCCNSCNSCNSSTRHTCAALLCTYTGAYNYLAA